MIPSQSRLAYAAVDLLADCPDKERDPKLQAWLADWDRVKSQTNAMVNIRPEFAEKYELGCRHARESIVNSVVEEYGFDWLLRTAAMIKDGRE